MGGNFAHHVYATPGPNFVSPSKMMQVAAPVMLDLKQPITFDPVVQWIYLPVVSNCC